MNDRADNIRRIKQAASEPKPPKFGSINKKSAKTIAREAEDAELIKEDNEFYRYCWVNLPHECFECGVCLIKFNKWHIHHILPKREYPNLRHELKNTCVLCLECHSKAETNIDFAPKIKELTIQTKKLLLNE